MLVFDIGFYRGEDTQYYLSRGYKVVAFEANPVLAAAGREMFAPQIQRGDLVLNACGIGTESGHSIEFFLHQESEEWSTFYKEAAMNWGQGKSKMIEVPCITPAEAFEQFGIPEYLKCDIEGYDVHVAASLQHLARKPLWVSFEATHRLMLRHLLLAGYQSFTLVDQTTVPRQKLTIGNVEFSFPGGGTGPFGDDLQGPWLSLENAMYMWHRFAHDPFAPSTPPGHWFDLHARLAEPAEDVPQLLGMKKQIDELYRGHCGMSGLRQHKPLCPVKIRAP